MGEVSGGRGGARESGNGGGVRRRERLLARAFVRLISEPAVMQACVGVGMRSEWLMARLLTIMANLLRPDDLGAAELAYRAIRTAATRVPEGVVETVLGAIEQRSESRAAAPA